MPVSESYQTVRASSVYQGDPVKGSKFIAVVYPLQSEMELTDRLENVRGQYPDANHHCWAFRVRENERSRSSDDGEPGGSAGRPILAQIVGHDVYDVLVVVIRYFGGTKLGVGGLIRAYGGAAGRALDRAERCRSTDS